jgi:hypothetical protein
MECGSILELVGSVGNFGGLWPVKRMEGLTMKYEEAEKILYKNVTPLPRTYSEARRDADYACWVEVPKGELDDILEFGWGMLFAIPFLGMSLYFLWVVLNRT